MKKKILVLMCKLLGHIHIEKVSDGGGCVDEMWRELCQRCNEDRKEEPENWELN